MTEKTGVFRHAMNTVNTSGIMSVPGEWNENILT
jgi:hypothetical protein